MYGGYKQDAISPPEPPRDQNELSGLSDVFDIDEWIDKSSNPY
jgi:hypothetical protein